MSDQYKWDIRFLNLAHEYSTWSKDPSRKIGAVAVKDKRVISSGYNGFPRGIADTEERLNDRQVKYKYIVHAESNCVINAAYEGVSLAGSTLYVYGLPVCSDCAKLVVQAGVRRVVMRCDDVSPNWVESFQISKEMFDEVGIDYEFDSLQIG
jgi:dCMP deaminase